MKTPMEVVMKTAYIPEYVTESEKPLLEGNVKNLLVVALIILFIVMQVQKVP
jgi:hypothetical protein